MNILTDINIKGEVYINYAFLSYELNFKNKSRTSASAEYSFSLPEDAVISDAKIIDNTGVVTKMSVIPLSHASALWTSAESAILRRFSKTDYSLKIGKISPSGCLIAIKVYVPVTDGLTIPASSKDGMCRIELSLHKISDFSSPTHTLKNIHNKNGIAVSTEDISADRDFKIVFSGDTRANSAIVVDNAVGGEMLCRLNIEAEKHEYKKLLLVYDKALTKGAMNAVREFICAAAEEFGGEFAVAEKDEKYYFVTDGFVPYTDEALAPIYQLRNHTDSVLDINACGNDTLKLLLCEKIFSNDDFHTVTFGGINRNNSCTQKREHIYGKDNIRKRAKEILKKMCLENADITIKANGAEAKVICSDRKGCIAYVRYAEEMPTVFNITRGNSSSAIRLTKAEFYKSFAPLGLVYAELLCEELRRNLTICPPCEIPHIRSKIEEIGIKYSAINSETAIAAVTGTGKPCPVRVYIPGDEADVFQGRVSMFKESDVSYTSAESAYLISLCKEIIYMNIRSCGGVYERGELNPDMQRYQTLVCLLSLVSSNMAEGVFDMLKNFVGNFSHKNLKVTDDASEAEKLLTEEFGNTPVVLGGVPDILTAAKTLWQMKSKNNSIFC